MRLPVEWLREFCDPPLSAEDIGERLDLTGTELGHIEHHGVGVLDRFVVGRVVAAEPHPRADRLTVCRVDVGEAEPAQIVCGAPNVAAGQVVPVARPGAVMPDGTRLGAAELRGVRSEGMILAEDELAISDEHAATMVLADDLAPGRPLAGVLPIATEVLELEITPNRPDCLAVYGLAREVHAATGAPLSPPPWDRDPGSEGVVAGVEVLVEDRELCPRFTARVFEDVRVGPSPPWLKARLTAAGQRPISNVVDITNYVMLLTGQPLHAFDLDRVAGGRLVVRRAGAGEEVETLDGQVRRLDERMLLIADDDGPTSIAAVMGGARSEVSAQTTRVLMEVASWNGPNVQRTSTRLGLRSEASARFEKGLSPELTLEAQAVAAILMTEVAGATLRPGTIDVGGPGPPPRTIRLRGSRVAQLLGLEIPARRRAEILRSLGFDVAEDDDAVEATVPHWRRNDVTREVDLVEEVARIDGLDKLPATLPARRGASGRLTPRQRLRRRAEDALAGRGVHEMAGWSLTDPGVPDRLRLPEGDPRRRMVALANPMAAGQSVLRTTLAGSLLDGARHNAAHGATDVRLFEAGAVYLPRDPGTSGNGAGPGPDPADLALTGRGRWAERLPRERHHVGAILTGAARPATWRDQAPPAADFFAAKGLLAALLDTLRVRFEVVAEPEPFLHPGRSARVLVAGAPAGWVGEIHPQVAAAWDLEAACAFEVDLDAVAAAAPRLLTYADLTSFPVVREDLALVVGEEVPAAAVVAAVREAGAPTLGAVRVFDVYRGPQVGAGRKSLAVALEFRAGDRTLTDEEVAGVRERIVAALRRELGAAPRA